jgi:hypothetical protein
MGRRRQALLEEGLNWCNLCETVKSVDAFVKDKRLSSGIRGRCKQCVKTLAKEIADNNRAATRLANKRSYIARNYGLSYEEYQAKLAAQKNECSICQNFIQEACENKLGKNYEAHLDHDHESDEIREFLCYRCNVGLGLFRDDPELLSKAAKYLAMYRGGYGGS